jgi:hypothetical protein
MPTTAADLTAAVERLTLGDPSFTAAAAAAERAKAAERDAATAVLFPEELHPVPADAIAEYAWRTGRLLAPNYCENLAELHRRSIKAHPALSRLLLSPEALADVAAAAASCATPASFQETHREAGDRAGAAARARYTVLIARQLAAVEGHEHGDAARALVALEDLAPRVVAVRERHEQHERDEAARAAAERRAAQAAADKATDAAEVERKLVELLTRHGLPTTLRGGVFCDQHVERLELLVRAERRLRTTAVSSIRVNTGSGIGLHDTGNLSRGLAEFSANMLREVLAVLDRAEGIAS